MKKIRFGIIGSGYMGSTHAEAVRRLPNAELVAVAGGSRAPALAERYKMAFEADKEALLRRADIDAIVVTNNVKDFGRVKGLKVENWTQ